MSSRYLFGPFVLDRARGDLRRDDRPVALRPKCFDLLLFLASHPGELISKERLLEEVWPDVVVNDATLSRTVTELREALGDDAKSPQYIETAQRRGYRFIAAVRKTGEAPAGAAFMLVSGARHYRLQRGEQIIGRSLDVAVAIPTQLASRQHARVVVDDDGVHLEDLGSRNGTFVNDRRIEGRASLKLGDRIRIGDQTLTLRSDQEQTADV